MVLFEPAQFREALQKKVMDLFLCCRRPIVANAFLHSLANPGKQADPREDPFFSRHHPRLSHFREQGEARVVGDPVVHGAKASVAGGAMQAGAWGTGRSGAHTIRTGKMAAPTTPWTDRVDSHRSRP